MWIDSIKLPTLLLDILDRWNMVSEEYIVELKKKSKFFAIGCGPKKGKPASRFMYNEP